jgi:cold shock CspA family protein
LTPPLQARLEGTVVEYDDHAGIGEVEAEGTRYFLHCTQITDGSRHLDVGQTVTFHVAPGHLGRWEAVEVG